jgi:hypothetical protein
MSQGRAIAQAVSHEFPTAAARVRYQVMSCKICGGYRGTAGGFLRVFRFPLPILIPSMLLHTHHLSSGAKQWPTYQVNCLMPPQDIIEKM